jgi:hypothetical protein
MIVVSNSCFDLCVKEAEVVLNPVDLNLCFKLLSALVNCRMQNTVTAGIPVCMHCY